VALTEVDGRTIAGLVVAISAQGKSPKSLHNTLIPVRACLRWHYRMGTFDRDPTPWFDSPAPPPNERRILTIAQIERLIDAMPAFYRPLVMFAAYTGVRLGELRAITWADIDFTTRMVRIDKTYFRSQLQRSTKSGHDRDVPLPPHVVECLQDWRGCCPDPSAPSPLFPDRSGRVLDEQGFRGNVWHPAVARAGLPATLRIHDLRHTSASLYLQHGATVREVMAIHGWRKLETAQRYLHTVESLNAAADRLDAAWEEAVRG
jgi:integrase